MQQKILYTMVLCAILLAPCAAADTGGPSAAGSGSQVRSIVGAILDNALAITIVLIFFSALVGFFLKGRAVDKCLKDFKGYMISVENSDKTAICGEMEIYPTGMELRLKEPVRKNGALYYSHIVYKSEFSNIRMVCRYPDILSPKENKRRAKDIHRSYKPGLCRRFKRSLRNALGTFRDAFLQSLGVVVGEMKKKAPSVIADQDRQITAIGADIIGFTGNTYDPILEKYIGYKVIVEVGSGADTTSYCGIFKEYSPDFLEILNIQIPHRFTLFPKPTAIQTAFSPLAMEEAAGKVRVKNTANFPVYLESVETRDRSRSIGKLLEAQQSLDVDEETREDLSVTAVRQVDTIFPRSKTVVRHAADPNKMDWRSAIKFDLLRSINE